MINRRAYDRFIISVLNGTPHSHARDASFWRTVLDRSVQEGVFYPFYKNLLLHAKDAAIPTAIRERYKQTYYLHAAKSSVFMLQVSRALSRIESRNINVLLFKGPAIDSYIYDDFLRPRLDLDIAVTDGEMPVLEKVLRDSGYKAPSDHKDYPIPEYLNSRLFVPVADELVPVHVHSHLINNMFLTVDNMLPMDMQKVREQAVLFKDYRSIYMLKPEMNILYLCEHGLKHDFDRLVYAYEIDQLLRHYGKEFDWKQLSAKAGEYGLARIVYYSLCLTSELFSSPVPKEIIKALTPAHTSRGEQKFMRNALALEHKRYASYPVYVSMRRGLLRKIYFVFRTFFPPGFGLKGYLMRMHRALKELANPLIL